MHATRFPWPADFPDVVIHTTVKLRDAHPAYASAKAGDADAAIGLARDLLRADAMGELSELIGRRPALLMPITADETMGFNAIPDAMAQEVGGRLKLPIIAGAIVQVNKVGHTRAPAFQRIVTPAVFEGPVEAGCRYVLVDDHVGLGGTLANLRGHIEANGGHVVAMTTLTESRDARRISLTPETRDMLWAMHGDALDQLLHDKLGHGIDCLTEVEALQFGRHQSIAGIADFMAQAAVEARGRGLSPTV